MEFRSSDEIKRFLKAKMQPAIIKAEEQVYMIIDRFIKQFYAEYSPELYERTYQLYRSLVKSEIKETANGYEATVYFDLSNIDYSYRTLGGKRYSHNGASPDEVMAAAAKGGHGAEGWKIASHGTGIYDDPINVLNKEAINLLVRMLQSEGIPIRR